MGMTLGASAIALDLNAFAGPVPRKAAELSISINSGGQLLLSSLKGKVVALEFLLTTCSHCQRCSGILQQMYQEFGPQGFQPIGAAINVNASTLIPEFIRMLGLKYPVGAVPQRVAYEFLGSSLMEPLTMPQLVFIDRKGVVQMQYAGNSDFFNNEEVNMRNTIEAMLKGQTGAKKPAR
jgi:hypothetical protein